MSSPFFTLQTETTFSFLNTKTSFNDLLDLSRNLLEDKMKKREPTAKKIKNKVDIPVGKWIKCDKCQEILYKEDVRKNNSICPNCGAYFRMHINKRLESILDKESYKRFDLDIDTTNPLNLEDYPKKIKGLREKTGIQEAVGCGVRKNKWRRCCDLCNG